MSKRSRIPFQTTYHKFGTPVYRQLSGPDWTCPEIGVLALSVDPRHRELASTLMNQKPTTFRSLYDVLHIGTDYERRLIPMFLQELEAARARPVAAGGLTWVSVVGPAGIIEDFDDLRQIVRGPAEKRSLSVYLFGRLVAEAYNDSIQSEERSRALHAAAERCRQRDAARLNHRTS